MCQSTKFPFTDCPNTGETVQNGVCACANIGETVQNGTCACPVNEIVQNGVCASESPLCLIRNRLMTASLSH